MGADQNFSRNRSVGLYPKNTANPSPRVCENSYGQAISQQHTLENSAEAKLEKLHKQQHTESDRSDQFQRPVPSRQPETKASKGKS